MHIFRFHHLLQNSLEGFSLVFFFNFFGTLRLLFFGVYQKMGRQVTTHFSDAQVNVKDVVNNTYRNALGTFYTSVHEWVVILFI
jgi:hypothetical protein